MNKIKSLVSLAVLSFLPLVTFAQDGGFDKSGGEFGELLVAILGFINGILIPFILGIGFLFFVWGMFQYFIFGGANDESKEKGRSLMVYATLGFVLIIIFWGVVNLIAQSFGDWAGDELEDLPKVTVPAVE